MNKDTALDLFLGSTCSEQIGNTTYLLYDKKETLQDALDNAFIKADIPIEYDVKKGRLSDVEFRDF